MLSRGLDEVVSCGLLWSPSIGESTKIEVLPVAVAGSAEGVFDINVSHETRRVNNNTIANIREKWVFIYYSKCMYKLPHLRLFEQCQKGRDKNWAVCHWNVAESQREERAQNKESGAVLTGTKTDASTIQSASTKG